MTHGCVTRAIFALTPAGGGALLFNAGFTPTSWNQKILADPHLTVPYYAPNSDELFPGTNINGGIAVTSGNSARNQP